MPICQLVVVLLTAQPVTPGEKPAASARDALQPFNGLIGSWKGTGYPEGTRDERQKGTWAETITWEWRFKGPDAWLTAAFDKGKHFTGGELRFLPEKSAYQFTLTTPGKRTATFVGPLKDKVLTLDRADRGGAEDERLVVTLLHANRYLYRLEARSAGSAAGFTKRYLVGATKEGVPFADVGKGPECIVSGGSASIRVTHAGKEYFVCCSGCRDAFKEEPEKFIQEAEAKAKK